MKMQNFERVNKGMTVALRADGTWYIGEVLATKGRKGWKTATTALVDCGYHDGESYWIGTREDYLFDPKTVRMVKAAVLALELGLGSLGDALN